MARLFSSIHDRQRGAAERFIYELWANDDRRGLGALFNPRPLSRGTREEVEAFIKKYHIDMDTHTVLKIDSHTRLTTMAEFSSAIHKAQRNAVSGPRPKPSGYFTDISLIEPGDLIELRDLTFDQSWYTVVYAVRPPNIIDGWVRGDIASTPGQALDYYRRKGDVIVIVDDKCIKGLDFKVVERGAKKFSAAIHIGQRAAVPLPPVKEIAICGSCGNIIHRGEIERMCCECKSILHADTCTFKCSYCDKPKIYCKSCAEDELKKCDYCGALACYDHRRTCSKCKKVSCEVCDEFGGHYVGHCAWCGEDFCKKCGLFKCEICGSMSDEYCKDCIEKCSTCGQAVCPKHYDDSTEICMECESRTAAAGKKMYDAPGKRAAYSAVHQAQFDASQPVLRVGRWDTEGVQNIPRLVIEPREIMEPGGLEIRVLGYPGDSQMPPSQVWIEVYEGALQVHVWDGKSEDPITHKIYPSKKNYSAAIHERQRLALEPCIHYHKIFDHLGHHIVCTKYGDINNPTEVALECEDCMVVIDSFDYDDDANSFNQMFQHAGHKLEALVHKTDPGYTGIGYVDCLTCLDTIYTVQNERLRAYSAAVHKRQSMAVRDIQGTPWDYPEKVWAQASWDMSAADWVIDYLVIDEDGRHEIFDSEFMDEDEAFEAARRWNLEHHGVEDVPYESARSFSASVRPPNFPFWLVAAGTVVFTISLEIFAHYLWDVHLYSIVNPGHVKLIGGN